MHSKRTSVRDEICYSSYIRLHTYTRTRHTSFIQFSTRKREPDIRLDIISLFWLHYSPYIIAQRRWCNFIVCQGKCKRYLYTTVLSWRIFWFRVRQPGWGWSKMEHFQCKKPKDLFNFLICGTPKIDLNKKWLPKQKTIQNLNIDARGFRNSRNENPPMQEIGVTS